MYGMATLAPSINFPMDGLAFCWFSVGVCLVERTVDLMELGSGFAQGI